MQIEFYLVFSAAMVGIGVGSALSRRSIISVVMAIVTSGSGAVVAMATMDRLTPKENDGAMFALCLGAVLLVFCVLGCALAYRRFMSSGVSAVGEGNQLRH